MHIFTLTYCTLLSARDFLHTIQIGNVNKSQGCRNNLRQKTSKESKEPSQIFYTMKNYGEG